VFFIVLDLRLTRLEYSGTPFFMPLRLQGLLYPYDEKQRSIR
jgi:hypothetical protein